LRFAILGPLLVTDDGEVTIERRSHRRLLSILLFHAGQPLETDVLIDRFWGEAPPPTARAALQTHLSQLRRRLGVGVVETTGSGYRLALDGHGLDLADFLSASEVARAASRSGAWQAVVDATGDALALWRGAPFRELQDDDFAEPEIARLDELRAELIESRAEALLALGRNDEALPELERSVKQFPYRERIWEQLMLARARLGRTVDALTAYHEARRLFDEVGLDPGPALRELEERILREDPTLIPTRVRHNLPERRTRLIDRATELAEVHDLVDEHRVVSLTGVGGSGKTRLAVEVAERAMEAFLDGVWIVDLAPIADPDLVAIEVAGALGLRPERQSVAEALRESLQSRAVLVILDNCEHQIPAARTMAEALLAAGPQVRVLVTSREALGLEGERIYLVPPLEVPDSDDATAATLAGYPAVQLYADRAALVASDFAINEDNAQTVSSICRRLDGLPLAIELAAARMGSLAPEDVADRLDNRFRLLARNQPTAVPRHQTLDATVAWSYDHLSDAERGLFARLAVFNGTFNVAMVEEVGSDRRVARDAAASVLSGLVDKSLVVPLENSLGRRYRLLETIKDYARDRLRETGSVAAVQRRHADWFARLAEEAAEHFEDQGQLAWLERLDLDRDNLQAALDWSVRSGASRHVTRLADALGWYRAKRGHFGLANADVRLALDHLDEEPEREAGLRVRLAGAHYSLGEELAALEEVRRARDLVTGRAPSAAKVRALTEYADLHLRIVQENLDDAVGPAREAVAAASAIGDRAAELRAVRMLGSALAASGKVDDGVTQLHHALAIAQELETASGILGVYTRLEIALVDFAADNAAAAALADEALAWLDAGGDRLGGAASLVEWICYGFIKSGDLTRAEAILERVAGFHLEGSVRSSMFSLRTTLRWMEGRLDEAERAVEDLRDSVRATRYYRLLYPLSAEIQADRGHLEEVRRLTDEHWAAEVRPAEEPTKAGTLCALLRAEADAADGTTGARRSDHVGRAQAAMDRIHELLDRFPPRVLAGFRLETPHAFVLLAEAELSRVTTPDPDRWRRAIDALSCAYLRTYGRWRLAESLLAGGDEADGRARFADAHGEAANMGAALLRDRIAAAAGRAGISIDR
jgi:predicted ATPase/DNA-binding SARP family transcriptional activator